MWYPAQVISIDKNNVFFMDGASKKDLPESDIREIPLRVKKRHSDIMGKKFFDTGDEDTGFQPGVFTVMCYQPGFPGKTPNYWCERVYDTIVEKRVILEFDCQYVRRLVEKYEKSSE